MVAAAAVFAGVVGWSIARLTTPPAEVVDEPDYLTAVATVDEVRSELDLSVGAHWPQERELTSLLAGTVTSVGATDAAVAGPGTVLYSVDLAPVVLLAGSVPAFRTMASGTAGPDVVQLQEFLASGGWSAGPVDGRFGPDTERAVRAWQATIGATPDGVVDLGEVYFVDALPRVVARDAELTVGRTLAPGDRVGTILGAAPVFDLTVSTSQSAAIADGAAVEIVGSHSWTATVGARTRTDEGDVVIALTRADGTPVCADECDLVPLEGRTPFDAVVRSRPPVRGVTVPAAAVRTAPDGATVVLDERGRTYPVTVVATAEGWSVVRGIEAGWTVRVPVADGATQ